MLYKKLLMIEPQSERKIHHVGSYSYITSEASTISLSGNLTDGISSTPDIGDVIILFFAARSTSTFSLGSFPSITTSFTKLFQINNSYQKSIIYYKLSLYCAYKIITSASDYTSISLADYGVQNISFKVYRNADIYYTGLEYYNNYSLPGSIIPNPPAITPTFNGIVIPYAATEISNHTSAIYGFNNQLLKGTTNIRDNSMTLLCGHADWKLEDVGNTFDYPSFSCNIPEITDGYGSYIAGTLALKAKQQDPILIKGYDTNTDDQNSFTMTSHNSTVVGDLLLLISMLTDENTVTNPHTTPSGWTELVDDSIPPHLYVAYRYATQSGSVDYNFTENIADSTYTSAILYTISSNAEIESISTASAQNTTSLTVVAPTNTDTYNTTISALCVKRYVSSRTHNIENVAVDYSLNSTSNRGHSFTSGYSIVPKTIPNLTLTLGSNALFITGIIINIKHKA